MSFDYIQMPDKDSISQTTYVELIWVQEVITTAINQAQPNVQIASRKLAFGNPYDELKPAEYPVSYPKPPKIVAKYDLNGTTESPVITASIQKIEKNIEFRTQIHNITPQIAKYSTPTICYNTIQNGTFDLSIAHWEDISTIGQINWSSDFKAMELSGATTQKVIGLVPNSQITMYFDAARYSSNTVETVNLTADIGFDYILVLKLDETVWGWGQNDLGQLGLGYYSTREELEQCGKFGGGSYLDNIIDISTGAHHTIVLDQNNRVYSWGYGTYGQLGNNKSYITSFDSTPNVQAVQNGTISGFPQLEDIVKISSGNSHTLALDANGYVWAWGYNLYGQLGNGQSGFIDDTPSHDPLARRIDIDNIVEIAAGGDTSVALKNDGTVWVWGHIPDLTSDFLDDSPPLSQSTPTQVADINNVIKVACDNNSIFMLKNNGELWVISKTVNVTSTYQEGIYITEFGVPKHINRVMPVLKDSDGTQLLNVKDIDAKGNTAIVLLNDDVVMVWGYLAGSTSTSWVKYPIEVIIDNIRSIHAGNRFCGIIKNDNTLWVIGDNQYDLWEGESNTDPIQIPDFSPTNTLTYYLADSNFNIIQEGDALPLSGNTGWRLYDGLALSWKDVSYSNGQYAAVTNGNIMVSPDAMSWYMASTPSKNYSNIVAGTPEIPFIVTTIAGGGIVAYNGTNWVDTTTTGEWPWTCTGGIYGNNGFIVVGHTNTVLESEDGLLWNQHRAINETLNPGNVGRWADIAYGVVDGLSKFVAVAFSDTAEFPYYAMVSDDGISWTPISGLPGVWNSITYGNGLFVAVGTNMWDLYGIPNIMTSPDGINWTSRNYTPYIDLTSITYGNGRFVAVGTLGQVLVSNNGIGWNYYKPFDHGNSWGGVTFGNNQYVAVAFGATDDKYVMVAEDPEQQFGPLYTRYNLTGIVPSNGEIIVGFTAENGETFLIDNIQLCEYRESPDCGPTRINAILNPDFLTGVENWTNKHNQPLTNESWDSELNAIIIGGGSIDSCASSKLSAGELLHWLVSCVLDPPEPPDIPYPDPDELGYGLPNYLLPSGSKQTYPPFPQYRISSVPTKYTIFPEPLSAYANTPLLPNLVYNVLNDYPIIQFDYSHLILGNINPTSASNVVNMSDSAKTVIFVAKLDEIAPNKVYMEDILSTNIGNNRIGMEINSGIFYSGVIQKMVAGTHHSVIVDDFGKVATTGGNIAGQLGLGDNINRYNYTTINYEAIDIAAGARHTLILNNKAYSFGDNNAGQLGIGSLDDKDMPTEISLNNVIKVYAGGNISFFITSDDRIYGCGLTIDGQLGTTGTYINTPTELTTLHNPSNPITELATGGLHVLALRADGTVLSWGSNDRGQLGQNLPADLNPHPNPTVISGLNNIIAISAGLKFSLALQDDGTIWAWGDNIYGQLGLGDNTIRILPTAIGTLTNIVDIDAGFEHAIALTSTGDVYTWGRNNVGGSRGGQLGLGDMVARNIPTQVTISGVTNIGAGAAHTIASIGDATYGWGYNLNGQLGNGTTSDILEPIMIANTDKYIGITITYGRWGLTETGLSEIIGLSSNISRTYIRSNDWAIYTVLIESNNFRIFENNIELIPIYETGFGVHEHEFTQPSNRIQFGQDQNTANTNAKFDLAEFRLYNGNLSITERTQLYEHLYDVYFSGTYVRPEAIEDEVRTQVSGLTPNEHYVLDIEIASFEPENIGVSEFVFGVNPTPLRSIKRSGNTYPSRTQVGFKAASDTATIVLKSGEPGGTVKVRNVLLCVESDADCESGYTKLSFDDFKNSRGAWTGSGAYDYNTKAMQIFPTYSIIRTYDGIEPGRKIRISFNVFNATWNHNPPPNINIITEMEIIGADITHTFYGVGVKTYEFIIQDNTFTIRLTNKSADTFLAADYQLYIDDILVCAEDSEPCDGSISNLEVIVEWDGIPRKPVNLFNVAIRYTIRDWDNPNSKTIVTVLPDNEGVLGIPACTTWKQQGIAGNPSDTILKSGINTATLPNIKNGDIVNIATRNNWIWAIPNVGPSLVDMLSMPVSNPEGLIESIEILLLTNHIVPSGRDSTPNNPTPLNCTPDPGNDITISIRYISSFGPQREFSVSLNTNDFYFQDANFANATDVTQYLNDYGPTPVVPGYESYDINGDGLITPADVLALISAGHEHAWDHVSATGHGHKGVLARWESVLFELDTVDGGGLDQCTEPLPSDYFMTGTMEFPSIHITGSAIFVAECDAEVIITPISTGTMVCEAQSILLPARASGTWSLSFNYGTLETATLSWDASSTDIQNALSNLSNIGVDNVRVTGSDNLFLVEFIGDLCGIDVPFLTADSSNLRPPSDGLIIDPGDIVYRNCDGLDVVFCIDDTASMRLMIQSMKDQAIDYTNYIDTITDGNYRLGLILFKDYDGGSGVRTVVNMSIGNKTEFIDAIDDVVASSGGNDPEAQNHAVLNAVNDMAGVWREEDIARIIILISDADASSTGYDKSFLPGASPTEVANAAKVKNITVCSIQCPRGGIFYPEAEADLRVYPQITGGVFVQSTSDIAERAIIEGALMVCTNVSSTIEYLKINCYENDGYPGPYAMGRILRVPNGGHKLRINVVGDKGSLATTTFTV